MKENTKENSTAAMGYMMGLGALVLFFKEKENRFIRFHAIQSVFYSLCYSLVLLLLYFSFNTDESLLIAVSIASFAWMGGIMYAVYSIRRAKDFHFPLIGEWAERIILSTR